MRRTARVLVAEIRRNPLRISAAWWAASALAVSPGPAPVPKTRPACEELHPEWWQTAGHGCPPGVCESCQKGPSPRHPCRAIRLTFPHSGTSPKRHSPCRRCRERLPRCPSKLPPASATRRPAEADAEGCSSRISPDQQAWEKSKPKPRTRAREAQLERPSKPGWPTALACNSAAAEPGLRTGTRAVGIGQPCRGSPRGRRDWKPRLCPPPELRCGRIVRTEES